MITAPVTCSVVSLLSRVLVAPAALAVLLTGCSAGSDPDAAVPAPAPSPATSSAGPDATAAPSPTPTGTVIEVTYAAGELTGVEPRVEVPLGQQVVLRVTSDVVEEIHVHGYDLYVDIPAGGTGEVEFTADLAGGYEVELHEIGRPIFQLRVS